MVLVKTHIGKSKIHGLGVFASEFIPKGTKIWELTPGIDLEWNLSSFMSLPNQVQLYIRHWGYQDPTTFNYRLSFDNDRFMNWSLTPNVVGSSIETFATKDIKQGEELTYPYTEDLLGDQNANV